MGSGTYGFAPLNLLLVVLLFGLVLLIPWSALWRKPAAVRAGAKAFRPLKPKTGADCPICQAEPGTDIEEGWAEVLPRPWREGRSPHGRKKASVTRGYACDNRACVDYGITHPAIHD